MICAKTAEAIEMPSGMWTGGPKEPCMKCGPGFPRGRDRFFGGVSHGPLGRISNIRREPKLFGRWQQQ